MNTVADIELLKKRIDIRLNNHLCEMQPDYDDSITGFHEAWDIVRAVFAEEAEKSRDSTMMSERHRAMIAKALGLFIIVAMIIVLAIAGIFAWNRQQHSCDFATLRETREELKAACPRPVDIHVSEPGEDWVEIWSYSNGAVVLRNGIIDSFEYWTTRPPHWHQRG